jgi:hypothetical protein
MEAEHPSGVEECKGLAQGLGFTAQEYFTAMFSYRYSLDADMGNRQCTLVATADSDGAPLLGKTDDIGEDQLGMNVMEVCRPDSGLAHVGFHFAGTIFTVAGMNERGLAMGMTGIPGAVVDAPGLFSLVALNTILPRCADVPAAIAHLRTLRLNTYGFSLMVGDADGRLALLECTSAGVAVLAEGPAAELQGQALTHTNGILDAALAAEGREQPPDLQRNSSRRYDAARRMLREGRPLDEIVCGRSSDGQISQAGDDPVEMHTDFAVVCSPTERSIKLWAGVPHTVEPEVVDVAQALA